MILKCQHCKNEWFYKGKQKHYTNCPRCMYKVKVKPWSSNTINTSN